MQEKKKVRPEQIQYALDLEAAVSTLESKLNEERICENAVSHTIEVIRDFYDADCVLVVVINPQSLTLRLPGGLYIEHRRGFDRARHPGPDSGNDANQDIYSTGHSRIGKK